MKERVVVSTKDLNLENYTVVKSLQEIDWSALQTLIYNDSIDGEVEIVKKVQQMADEDKNIIYISENIDPFLYCIFTGIGADIYDTDSHLEDETILDFFVNKFKETGMTIATPSKDIEQIAKSIATLSQGDSNTIEQLLSNKMWLQSLELSIKNVDNALVIADQVNTNVVAVLQETSAMIESLEKGQDRTTKEIETFRVLLEKMKAELKTQEVTTTPQVQQPKSLENNMFMYSPYDVPIQVPKVLYVKAYGTTRYLLSFLKAFKMYMKVQTESKVTCNLLVTIPRLPLLIDKFTKMQMPRLCKDTIGLVDMKNNDEFFTYEPTKDVLNAFFNHRGRQLFIVVDFMYGDDLLKGNKVEQFAAVSGTTDCKAFKLNPERVISTIHGLKEAVVISHISKYNIPDNSKNKKYQLYFLKNEKALMSLREKLGY